MATLLQRIAGWMQPWEFPPAYVVFDADAAALMVMSVEQPPKGEPYKYIVIAESPRAAERFLEDAEITDERWRISPPLSIRQIREWFYGMDDEVTAVMTYSEDDFHIGDRESFVAWMDEMIAKGAH